jgi:hypothetical protein
MYGNHAPLRLYIYIPLLYIAFTVSCYLDFVALDFAVLIYTTFLKKMQEK